MQRGRKADELAKKSKRVKRPAKKPTIAPTANVTIRDTLGVSVSKKKAPTKVDRGKGIELLSDAALLEAAQLKKALKKNKLETHKLQASGSSEGDDLKLEVPDESKGKSYYTSKGTGVKPRVPDVSKAYSSDSDNESWGESEDESDDVKDDDDNENDDDSVNDDGGGNDTHDSERTYSDDDEKLSFTLKDYEEEEHNKEYEANEEENVDEYEFKELYEDVNTESSKQKSFVSFDFADQFLIFEKDPPFEHEVASLINVKMSEKEPSTQTPSFLTEPEKVIPDTSMVAATTVPPTIIMITPPSQLTTPSPAPTTNLTTTSIPALFDFSSLFGFDQRLSTLEKEIIRIRYATQTALQSYTKEFKKKAQEERKLYIDLVEKLVKDILKNEVKSQLPLILPKEVADFATHVIQSTVNESLENIILAKSSSQPESTYQATALLTEFELKKILLDKMENSKSYQEA
uniref:Uncharacterized protein n=1 Tax=Tanacetum cinerariifolium TaxID=118510 RepID=A0A6L2JZD3_TANCI|nr:hypothetical protein [Tanacetum cinerariifolium]